MTDDSSNDALTIDNGQTRVRATADPVGLVLKAEMLAPSGKVMRMTRVVADPQKAAEFADAILKGVGEKV